MMENYPDELACDMAETYGIFDIKRVPVKLLATLAVGLRENSRVKMAKSGVKVDDQTLMLAIIADCLRWIQWSKTQDGIDGKNMPERLINLYFEQKNTNSEHEVFNSPEEYKARWQSITEK
jgi:hypothetical protein